MFCFRICTGLFIGLLAACNSLHSGVRAPGYVVSSGPGEQSEQWAAYLYSHLYKRSTDKSRVLKAGESRSPAGYKQLHVEVVPDLGYDYCFSDRQEQLQLRVQNKRTALWVTYQLMAGIGETDDNYETGDLPPAFITFTDQCRSFDFAYREPHLQPNMNAEYAAILGTNHVEEDWGLWGHNLHKVVTEEPGLYAEADGKQREEQYCFSSPGLYKQLKHYITDRFGSGQEKTYRFMIAPSDNDVVCTCGRCEKLGNTKDNATPAVGYLLNKLANTFPRHHFYTLAYRTTRKAPEGEWAANTGIFFTTIDLPKGVELPGKPEFETWKKELRTWKKQVSRIYLWDYISNFDDYLTPLPVLNGFQQQLSAYRETGIKGLFLNGSGYDYSPFDDVKTYVLAALMINKDVDAEQLVKSYLEKFYPRSHKLLAGYYLQLEHQAWERKKPWPMYGSFTEIQNTYLGPEAFITFYEALKKQVSQTSGEEHHRLDKLLTALSFTRLQLAYHQGTGRHGGFEKGAAHLQLKPGTEEDIEQLKRHGKFPDMKNYRETEGHLAPYIAAWEEAGKAAPGQNLMPEGRISFVSPPDEGYADATLLHNGLNGFTSDYHQGWVINGGEVWELAARIPREPGVGILEMTFLNMPEHRILPPDKVEIMDGGRVLYTFVPSKVHGALYRIREHVEFPEKTTAMGIRIFKSKQQGRSTVACDEIKLLKTGHRL